jgi:hypothetical protein
MHSLFDGRCLESTYAWEPNSSAPLLSISVRTRTAHLEGEDYSIMQLCSILDWQVAPRLK